MNKGYDAENFRKIFESEYTWLNGFMRNVRRFKNETALFCPTENKRFSYGELNRLANKLANSLTLAGIRRQDVIMCRLMNCAELVLCYLAAQKIGAVMSPLNFRLSPGETAAAIDDSLPKAFIYALEDESVVEAAFKMCAEKPEVTLSTLYDLHDGSQLWEFIKDADETDPLPCKPFNIYDEVTRLYTSGTTGNPKGVPISSINEVLTAHDCMMNFPLRHGDITMNTTPWFHRGGLHAGGPAATLYAGGQIIVMRKFEPRTCLTWVEQYKISFLIGVPAVLNMLTKEQESLGMDLSSLSGIITMGSPLERAACTKFMKELTPNIFNGYGTTETFWNTFLSPADLPERAGFAGRACTDDDVRVVKLFDDRTALPHELAASDMKEIGEIIIKSPAKSTYCYYNNETETEKKFRDGYIYTGDLGLWNEEGYVAIVGRKDDMIISGGENIYPSQIEEILNLHPKVSDCVVTSVADKKMGEIVTAYVVTENDSLTAEELDAYCKESAMISDYKRPRYYRFVEDLPINATGKKQHYLMKKIAETDYENGRLRRV